MTFTITILTIALIVLPQWILMIFKPKSTWTQRLVDSDIIPFILLVIYISCVSSNSHLVDTSSLNCLLKCFQTNELVIAVWAYFGFVSLIIGGWLFNNLERFNIHQNWVKPILLTILMFSPFLIGFIG